MSERKFSDLKTWQKKFVVGIWSFAACVILIIVLFNSISNKKNDVLVQEQNILNYSIMKMEDQSYLGTKRMTYRVILDVTKIPLKKEINDVAISIWGKGNKSWAEFTIFFYLPEMDINNIAFGVVNFTPYGLKDLLIQEYSVYGTKWENLIKN